MLAFLALFWRWEVGGTTAFASIRAMEGLDQPGQGLGGVSALRTSTLLAPFPSICSPGQVSLPGARMIRKSKYTAGGGGLCLAQRTVHCGFD